MKTRRMYKAQLLYKAELSPLDRISTLPQPILDTILCRLDIGDAARTSILSREWRYKWTTIPKLELPHYFYPYSKQTSKKANTRRKMDKRCDPCYYIRRILLQVQGPIQELTLMFSEENCSKYNQIIGQMSRKHNVKKLNLYAWDLFGPSLKSFTGFGNLESLCLEFEEGPTKTILDLLSNNPSLKSLTLLVGDVDKKCTINELLECLPMIERLTTWTQASQWIVLDSVPRELPTSLIHLRYLCFKEMCFDEGCGLPFLFLLIKCSPNLVKIKLENNWCNQSPKKYPVAWEEYSNVWLEHLNELEFGHFRNTKPEMELVKLILARSPKLKKVIIHCMMFQWNQESKMLRTLLQAPRASPVVITVKNCVKNCVKF